MANESGAAEVVLLPYKPLVLLAALQVVVGGQCYRRSEAAQHHAFRLFSLKVVDLQAVSRTSAARSSDSAPSFEPSQPAAAASSASAAPLVSRAPPPSLTPEEPLVELMLVLACQTAVV